MPKFSQRSLMQHERETGAGTSMREAAKPVAEHRYPRGYTPERQAAVSSALAGVEVVSKFHDHRDEQRTKESPYLSSSEFFTPDAPGAHRGTWKHSKEERHDAMAGQARRTTVDSYARSTVPVEHLEHHPAIHVEPLGPGAAGDYTNPGLGDMLQTPYSSSHGRIRMDPRTRHADADHTLVHELGHHRDFVNDPEAFTDRSYHRVPTANGGYASPGLEGAAEGYAQRHTVERGGASAQRLSYREFIPQQEFAERYAQASGGLKAHQHPSVQPEKHLPHVSDEPHLYQRAVDIAASRTEKDYGQFPLTVPWADRDPENFDPVHLSTIKTGRGVPSNTAAEGFRPGDADIVSSLRWNGGAAKKYAIPVEERKRVADTWNAKYPEDYVHHD